MTTGVNILNTLCDIERCYLLSDTVGKKRILNMLLQNSTLKGGNIDYTYKKPFNIFAKGLNHLVNLNLLEEFRTYLYEQKGKIAG